MTREELLFSLATAGFYEGALAARYCPRLLHVFGVCWCGIAYVSAVGLPSWARIWPFP